MTNRSQPFNIDKVYPFDPKQAKQLMAAAGVSKLSVNVYQPVPERRPALLVRSGTAVPAAPGP